MKKMLLILLLSISNYFVQSQNVTLNIRTLIQGFYRGSGTMVAAIDSINYPTICDTMTVNFLDTTAPSYPILYSATSTISTMGYGTFVFPDAVLGGTFFIQLYHRNALIVFSKHPVSFDNSIMTYDFTTIPFQLCADAMDSGDGFALIYSGDLNHDGNVDGNDFNFVDNAIALNLTGYLAEDINGDHVVDSTDLDIMNIANEANVFSLYPNGCLSTDLLLIDKQETISIYPNPTAGVLNISQHNIIKRGDLKVFNTLGEKIYSEIITPQASNQFQFTLHAPAGVYFVRLNSDDRQWTGKVIIE
jgi:hypothetical protein